MNVQVTPLRQRMIDDMAIRNMSLLTQKAYVRAVSNFSLHFRRSPDKLTFEDVRAYQLHLVSRGLEATTINQIMCALRFLYGTTLGKKDASEEIKLARQSDPLPVVLSRDEVARFLKAVPDLRWWTALVTIYASGLRVSEAVSLTDVAETVLTSECRARLTDKTVIVAAIVALPIVAAVVGISVIAERGGRNRTGGAEDAFDHAGSYVARPKAVIAVINPHGLMLTDGRGPRGWILRQRGCRHCSCKNRRCSQELQVHSLSPLW